MAGWGGTAYKKAIQQTLMSQKSDVLTIKRITAIITQIISSYNKFFAQFQPRLILFLQRSRLTLFWEWVVFKQNLVQIRLNK